MPPDPLALACFACWLCFAQHNKYKDCLHQTLAVYVVDSTENMLGPLTTKHLPKPMMQASASYGSSLRPSNRSSVISQLYLLHHDCLAFHSRSYDQGQ